MKRRIWSRLLLWAAILAAILLAVAAAINIRMVQDGGERILPPDEAAKLEHIDCILVLGCLVHDSGRPSDMLRDRLRQGVELYTLGAAPKLLMSGDHGRTDYNEVAAMKAYATDSGIDPSDVFMDHAGFSTYDSLYRARDVFEADRILIVTQEYHLYRALWIAERLGLEAWGVSSDYHTYVGQGYRDFREALARCKDFGMALLQPEPTFLGEVIPISGDGTLTDDGAETP